MSPPRDAAVSHPPAVENDKKEHEHHQGKDVKAADGQEDSRLSESSADDDRSVDALADALHAELNLGAEAADLPHKAPNKVLVLLDCNGLLLHRSKTLFSGRRKPDFNVRTGYRGRFDNYVYIRPHARELICCLLNDSRCEVAVYTSIMAKNIMPIVQAFDTHHKEMSRQGHFETISCGASTASTGYIDEYSSTMMDDSLGLFDQEYNSNDPQGENEWDTVRDLNKIFRARKVRAGGFGKHNTLIVDAEARKVKNCKGNAIVLQEYTEHHLLLKPERETSLKTLWEYLDETLLSKMQHEDTATNGGVPYILRNYPIA